MQWHNSLDHRESKCPKRLFRWWRCQEQPDFCQTNSIAPHLCHYLGIHLNKMCDSFACIFNLILFDFFTCFHTFQSYSLYWLAKKVAFLKSHDICSIKIIKCGGKTPRIINYISWDHCRDSATQHLKFKFLSHDFYHGYPNGFSHTMGFAMHFSHCGYHGFCHVYP